MAGNLTLDIQYLILRIAAALIDFFITSFMITVIIVKILSLQLEITPEAKLIMIPEAIFVFLWMYSVGSEASRMKGTLGKYILNLQVAPIRGEKLSILRATLRFFFKCISVMTFCIV